MNFDFWDLTQLNILMTVRDYYRDKARKARDKEDFEPKVMAEVVIEAAELSELAISVFEKANSCEFPKEAYDGVLLLPFHCFSQALQMQRGPVTKSQYQVLEICTETLNIGFRTDEFLTSNDVSKRLHQSVGITMDYMGSFWKHFFKAVYVTDESPEILEKLARHMTAVVMRLAMLGKADLNEALPLCENCLKVLVAQSVNAYDLPESEIDYMGEASYMEHKRRAENIAKELVCAAGDEDKLHMDDMLPIFFLGLLYDLVDRSKGTMAEKGEMLQFAIARSQLNVTYDGNIFFREMKLGDEKHTAVRSVIQQFLPVLGTVSMRADQLDRCDDFIRESTNFLIGLEKELAANYPSNGFGRLASPLMSGKIDILLEYIRA